MRVATLTGISYKVLKTLLYEFEKNTVVLIAYGILPPVDMLSELALDTKYLLELALISKQCEITLIIGVNACVDELKYRSVLVINNGYIMGMSDMVHTINDYDGAVGNAIRIYDIMGINVGIIVDDDILFPEVARQLTLNNAGLLVHMSPKDNTNSVTNLIKAHTLINGTKIISLGDSKVEISHLGGELVLSHKGSINNFNIELNIDNSLLLALREQVYYNVTIETNK